jgi:ribosome biogenesis GTPase
MSSLGLVVSSHGRHYIVEIEGKPYHGLVRGKKSALVVGDKVMVNLLNLEQVQIIELIPRDSLIYRSDLNRSKLIASNISQILIVIAIKPNFNRGFLDSCLICAESSGIKPLIIINKQDLEGSTEFATAINSLYQLKLNYPILKLSALSGCSTLMPLLHGHCNLLIGQSGMGKSTITNSLCPSAQVKCNTITKAQTSGSHTTTSANLYHLNSSTTLIDCPGLQEFGLMHLELSAISNYFPEMQNFLGQCKFANCKHLSEPGCAIIHALAANNIEKERYQFYQRLCTKLGQKRNY